MAEEPVTSSETQSDHYPTLSINNATWAFSERQVEEMLGLSRLTVRRLRLSGALRHIKVGRRILYPAVGIVRFLAGQAGEERC